MNLFAFAFAHPGWIWILVGVILLVMELTLPGLLLFFFGLGAVVTGLAVFLLPLGLSAQLLLFSVLSVVMLLTLRRVLKPILYRKGASGPDSEEFTGRTARVTEAIAPPLAGAVEFNGCRWSARADAPIASGDWVAITGRDNLTLLVKPLSTP